ncbi:C-type lectin domain family 5 member A-like [Pogoniulus pusillus]|uniref:C-type lectin domain family 5 member A-like n=1 Tax=Pogoniulus pusillus TaxID=488313 RepID=UPI0030B94FD5
MPENVIYADLNLTQPTSPRQQTTDTPDCTYAEVKVQSLDTNADASYTSTGKRCCSRTRVAGAVAVTLLLLVVVLCLMLTYHPTASSSPDIRTLPTTYEETLACPKNWERNGGKCYFFSKTNGSAGWNVSREECTKKGAELVVIDNKEELDYLSSRSKCCYYLLGLRYSESEKKWKWINGVEHSKDMFEIKKEPDYFCAVIRSGKVESAACTGASSTQNMCEKAAGTSERQRQS